MSVLTAEGGSDGIFSVFLWRLKIKKALYLEAGRWQQGKWKAASLWPAPDLYRSGDLCAY